jgi:hypothetical protein
MVIPRAESAFPKLVKAGGTTMHRINKPVDRKAGFFRMETETNRGADMALLETRTGRGNGADDNQDGSRDQRRALCSGDVPAGA